MAWLDFNKITLRVATPGSKGYQSYRGQWDRDSMDIQVEIETSDGSVKRTGTVLMIAGRMLATKGKVASPGYEMDALDAAVLTQQLLFRMLGAVFPNGPATINGSRAIDHSDKKNGIQFATASAEGFVSAPWRVKGAVRSLRDNVIEYDLSLTSGTTGRPAGKGGYYEAHFLGSLSRTRDAKVNDAMPLEGWSVFGVGVHTFKSATGTAFDYSAAASERDFKTVADIRKKVAADNYSGMRDPTKDFTGFWKSKCDDAFGLQIMHFGSEGKYSIVFCGPGGCGDPTEGRITFITGDPHFEVVSEAELFQIAESGEKSREFRCTKDTHPVLKY